jgi:hypothetical protein
MAYDVQQLLRMSQADLDALFTSSPPGPIPDGEARGTAIVAPGTTYSIDIANASNRITSLGLNAIIAKVYEGPSWLDNKPCIVLDYSETSLVAHWIRDEIRLIAPKIYLGKVYWQKKRLIDFALEF